MLRWLFALIVIFGSVAPVYAQEVPLVVAEPSSVLTIPPETVLMTVAPAPLTILTAVSRAKELLAPLVEELTTARKTAKPITVITTPVPVALALWNKQTDEVTVMRGMRDAKKFVSDKTTLTIARVGGTGVLAAFRGSNLEVVVVGVVQPNLNQVVVNKKKQFALEYSYYVPYTRDLYAPETLIAGSDYLSSLIQDAFDVLTEKGIKSRAFPDKLLTEVIDPYLLKAIAVIEHADGQIYQTDGSEDSLGRFLVKLGTNREGALSSAVSSAGARGLVQFIPSTYKLMVTKRPDLALIPDFAKGMADHRNAITASAAYLDMDLALFPVAIRELYLTDRGKAAEFMAAAYNGGSVRVRRAYALLGEDWAKDQTAERKRLYQIALNNKARMEQIDTKLAAGTLSASETKKLKAERQSAADARYTANKKRATLTSASLKKETVGYVVKLRRVYDMFASGFFATPAAPTGALPTVAVANTVAVP